MKTKLLATSLLLVSLFVFNGFIANSTRAIQSLLNSNEEFSGVILKTVGNVFITHGEKADARIECEPSDEKDIIMEVKNDKLVISSKEDAKIDGPVSIYVTLKTLNSLELLGSGNITLSEIFKSENMDIRLTGSGNVDANVETKNLNAKVAGSGDIKIKGKTTASEIEITGSGNVFGQDFKCTSSTINISGSGTSTIDVEDNLVVEITGSGNVYYISDPERIQAKSRGSGRIEKVKA